jgi:hypothetical protein
LYRKLSCNSNTTPPNKFEITTQSTDNQESSFDQQVMEIFGNLLDFSGLNLV